MEVQYEKYDQTDKDYFKLDYNNQDITRLSEFKKWYEEANEICKNKNVQYSTVRDYNVDKLFTIALCKKCSSYTICSIGFRYCFIICTKCKTEFCIGCYKERKNEYGYYREGSVCLKGYFKLLYLRIINRRLGEPYTRPLFFILQILLCLLITPLFLGFISSVLGFSVHPRIKKNSNEDDDDEENVFEDYQTLVIIYSFLRGFLMFPYIILFFPFMLILLLPIIFSYKYYLYIYNMYVTALSPGSESLYNIENN